jgi:hypothetical protein
MHAQASCWDPEVAVSDQRVKTWGVVPVFDQHKEGFPKNRLFTPI